MHQRVTVVVSVCVKSHLTSVVSVCPENNVVYSVGNGGPNICGFFSENALSESYGIVCHAVASYRANVHFFLC